MSKLTKDEKFFLKFRKEFSIIFNDQIFDNQLNNHFDKDGVFACFVLGLMTNKLGKTRLLKLIKSNLERWMSLFAKLYLDKNIIKTYKTIELNPYIEFNKITNSFDCFDEFINLFINFLDEENIDIGFGPDLISKFIKNGFGFLLYNFIDCQTPNKLKDILNDEKYDMKVQMIIYNTTLFGNIKNFILNNCKENVNDFIVLMLGMSKSLGNDK